MINRNNQDNGGIEPRNENLSLRERDINFDEVVDTKLRQLVEETNELDEIERIVKISEEIRLTKTKESLIKTKEIRQIGGSLLSILIGSVLFLAYPESLISIFFISIGLSILTGMPIEKIPDLVNNIINILK